MDKTSSPVHRLVSLIIGFLLIQVATVNATSDSGSESVELTALKTQLEALETKVEKLESRFQTSQQQVNDTQQELEDVNHRLDTMAQCCKGDDSANDTQSEDSSATTENDDSSSSSSNSSSSSSGTTVQTRLHCGKFKHKVTGEQQIWVNSQFRNVYCDGVWTVIQRRQNGQVDFYREWDDYEKGFGDVGGEYWLGLKALHNLTSSGTWLLKVELGDWKNATASAVYRGFKVLSASKKYKLQVSKFASGTAGDSLYDTHRRMKFSTNDNDNDKSDSDNCAKSFYGAWWYNDCLVSNLNGKYYKKSNSANDGIIWKAWKGFNYSLRTTLMKIKSV